MGFWIGAGVGELEAVGGEEFLVVSLGGFGGERDLDGSPIDELGEEEFVGALEDFVGKDFGSDEDEAAFGDV